MKLIARYVVFASATWLFAACSGGTSNAPAADSVTTAKTVDSGSTAGFKLGVQMWTFSKYSFTEALDKVDSSGIKNIEAYNGQPMVHGSKETFGIAMSDASKAKVHALLKAKGISIVAMGVIIPKDRAEWIKYFELAKDFGFSYLTAEPIKSQWDMVDSLAGVYGIPVAIHDHPKPNMYWSPDSVLAATKGHSHIGSCADVGHWARNGLNPVDCLKKLEGHIIGVHLKDIVKFDNPEAADTVVGKGVVDFPPIFAELRRQHFSGMLSIEHESNWYHSLPDVVATKAYYEDQLSKLK